MNSTAYLEALLRKTALSQAEPRLHHYMKFDSTKLALLLSRRLLRVSNPTYFNDPFDCRPVFHPDTFDDESNLNGFVEWVKSVIPQAIGGDESSFAASVSRIRNDKRYREQFMAKLSNDATAMVLKNYRMVCLTPHPDLHLMWSHYANGHRGICLEFDATKAPFSLALAVKYEREYPRLDFRGTAPDTFTQIGMLTKARCWEYEDEYRLISSEIDGTAFIRSHADLLELPEGALTGVILGLNSGDIANEVDNLIRRFSPGVALHVAAMHRGQFEIGISRNFRAK